ncbi:DMT family transporter [Aestuariivita boseongensis]|uniref:DMT family transporter n=1 Tax=Aestuariivita boseongensis TaxID=1470562 RepID=UPI00067FBDFA|nr:DMT family transporter [Aestuariivita boseongensis]
MKAVVQSTALTGAALVALYTALMSGADGITKFIAGQFEAPQLYAISGLIVVALSLLADRHPGQRRGLKTTCPRAMALRAGATVLAVVGFFYAFRLLPFADVFLFVGLIPIFAGLMSGPILGERVRPSAWAALCAAFVGVLCLFPSGWSGVQAGHLWALSACLLGTFSMVMARYIGRYETNALAQVFYPNLAIALVMGAVLPFVWKPMGLGDLAWIAGYAGLLFLARWVLVIALGRLEAYVVTPLMNLQFAWMVLIGAAFFGEYPSAGTYLGVAIVVGSGLYLLWDQYTPESARKPIWSARGRFRTDP